MKELQIWESFTDIPGDKGGSAVFLSLESKACEAASELEVEQINNKDGIKNIVAKLDKLYLKDETQSAYEAYDNFERFKCPSDMSISDYINEFERLLNKTKQYGTTMSTDVLAYRLLKSANLSETHEQLARTTIKELKYDEMQLQLRTIFEDNDNSNSESQVQIKMELITQTEHQNEKVYYGYNTFSQCGKQSNRYLRPSTRGGYRMRNRGNFQQQSFRGRNFIRGSQSQYAQSQRRNEKNPLHEYGQYTRCTICESIFHWTAACPHRKANAGEIHHHVTLLQSNLIDQDCMKIFISESLSAAVLDSAATSTVAGKTWMDCYIDSLPEEKQTKISYSKSQNMFKFGSGDPVKSLHTCFHWKLRYIYGK